MKLRIKERVLWAAVVMALTAVLITLAVLQYRWSTEISEATGARMRASLQASLLGFRQDLYREISSVCMAFPPESVFYTRATASSYGDAYQRWKNTAMHPSLVARVYLVKTSQPEASQLLRVNLDSGALTAAEWPERFERLREALQAYSEDIVKVRPLEPHAFAHRLIGPAPRPAGPRLVEVQPPMFWTFAQEIPALIRPVLRQDTKRAPSVEWLIVELDENVLQQHIFPELAARYFGTPQGLAYDVAVVAGVQEPRVIYASDESLGSQIASADARLNLFGPPITSGAAMPPTTNVFVPPPHGGPGPRGPREAREHGGSAFRIEPFGGPNHRDWQLVVRHRGGSLQAAVATLRRRNLAVSFGVLAVLGATMAMIIIASQRARRLAELQMNFVAAVSHELRTPLAVISSAADNIADGLVSDKRQVTRYGSVIKSQARQLIQLVEQILLFAATRQNRLHFDVKRLPPSDILNAALEATAGLIHTAGFTVDKNIDPQLPDVMGDLPALSQCLQNLITNAVKYSGDSRWIGIRACVGETNNGDKEVRITVEDRGRGIDGRALRHIFEPFYRSPDVAAAQIHGTGLGLSLAKSIAEQMGGRLTVKTEPGNGSAFTLHLPGLETQVPAASPDLVRD